MNLTKTVNVYIRVISSSLTPGFHCPDTRSYCERLGRLYGNGRRKGKSARDRPNRGLFWANGWIMRKNQALVTCLILFHGRRCIRVLQLVMSNSWEYVNADNTNCLIQSQFWRNLSILCSLFCSLNINFVACLRVWNIWKGNDIASLADRMLLCSAYFAISQFPAYTELQYFTILEHVLSLEDFLRKGIRLSQISIAQSFQFL